MEQKNDYIPMDETRRPYPYEMREQGIRPVRPKRPKKTWRDFLTFTNFVILINVMVYIIVMQDKSPMDPGNGNLILEHGGQYVPAIRDDGEYYRLFTAMFLHFNIGHLVNNMITIFMFGNTMEPLLGKVRTALVYLLGGLGGSIASYLYYLNGTSYPVSAGASGAAYALIGGFLAMAMFDPRTRGRMNPWQIIFMVIICIGSQFTDSSIGNVAHFMGFLSGFAVAAVLYFIEHYKRKRQNEKTEFGR